MSQPDRAAVGIGLLGIELQIAGDRKRLHGERFVGLDDIHLLDLEPRFLERLLRRRHRAYAHDFWIHAGEPVGYEPRHRLPPLLLRRPTTPRVCGAALAPGRLPRRDRAVLLERRAQLGEALGTGIGAGVLVAVEERRAFAGLQLDRQDLLLEVALLDGVDRAAVA